MKSRAILILMSVLLMLCIPAMVLSYERIARFLSETGPQPIGPGGQVTIFSPNVAVWFKAGVTENEARLLIESFGLFRYRLSDSRVWESLEHGGMAVIEVPPDQLNEYIHRLKSSDIVTDVQSNVIYESNQGAR